MKVLLADDNHFYRRLFESMLTQWGYEVVPASNGIEAWQLLQGPDAPRLALMDWMMPELDGLELCKRIRENPELRSTYVILITVRTGKESVLAAFQNGADDYIGKPCDPDELRARLRVGERMVEMQAALKANITELREALSGAQKMEAIGRLAGGVAHDFNNLLSIMTGASELLAGHPHCDAQQRELIQMIKEASERGAALTRQLLAFSRRQMLQPVPIDLNQLVTGVQKILQRLIGEDITLETRLEPSLGLIHADPGQIEQVILNLVVNARDAMPDGGTITIETATTTVSPSDDPKQLVPPNSYVVLRVRDAGRGMPPEVLPHIFEPFFTTKEAGKGTGLGLATVYGIVRQSEGFIDVQSTVGEGTTFTVYFPRLGQGNAVQALFKSRDTIVLGKGQTILVAEDDESVRLMFCRILDMHGYNVLEASNGKLALDLSAQHEGKIHLLLTDTVMPVMSGPQLANHLRESRPDTKVLFVSGYTDDALLKQKVLESGMPFLQKPFTPAKLLHKIQEVLNDKKCELATLLAGRELLSNVSA